MAEEQTENAGGGGENLDAGTGGGSGKGADPFAKDTLLGASGEGKGTTPGNGDTAKEGAANKEGAAKEKAGDPAATVPDKPEGYDLTFGDGTQVDEDLLGSFKATAHELGLTQGQSQKLAALYEGHVAKINEAALQAQIANLDKAQSDWEAQIKGDKEFQQNLTHARAALKEFATPELVEVMNQTRIGSFPAFFNFVAAVGKALAEPATRGGAATSRDTVPLRDRLWPNMK
jgi:hypothetical protein